MTGVTLLTGATGFLGAEIATQLLARGHRLRCLVRGATPAERTARLRSALPGEAAGDRLTAAAGDLAEELLGLTSAEFAELGRDVTRVVHCGARVNMTLPYNVLYAANVRATESLLDLAETAGASFCFVGSLAAVAPGVVGEPFELIDPVAGGYGQSKWSADRLVAVAHQEKRVRAVTVRPGRVTADSRTGRGNPDDLLEQVIRTGVRLGALPRLDTAVRITPVDWVAGLTATLADRHDSHGRAHHLESDRSFPWTGVLKVIESAGHPVDPLPYGRWRELVASAGRDDPAAARLAAALPAEPLNFDRRSGHRPVRVRRAAPDHPPIPPAEQLLRTALAAWQRRGDLG